MEQKQSEYKQEDHVVSPDQVLFIKAQLYTGILDAPVIEIVIMLQTPLNEIVKKNHWES